ncbi:prepilin-type N-terminal cleavage/methylation domain-containing protein [Sulfitobacter sp. HNIBRBA3233]|uniref:prepilin-type N-terminal cleavage/methylation domain-containing protein n=1 Tax=Sulfitobacter marinivivus TaxID=3158558 RepID=UPI0032DF9F49
MNSRRDRMAGVTLVEMLVALSLFAMVGLAAFTTLETILRVRAQTDGRLEHLARLDRALMIFGRDMIEADPQAITLEEGILSATLQDGRTLRRYLLTEGALQRQSGKPNADPDLMQTLVEEVGTLTFRVLDNERVWHGIWPDPAGDGAASAIDLTFEVAGSRTLRRLVLLSQTVPK